MSPESPSAAAPHGARVRACLAHHALEGKSGARMHAAIEQIRGRAHLVLRRAGSGAVDSEMFLRAFEFVDIGEGRVLIVPKCEPSELTRRWSSWASSHWMNQRTPRNSGASCISRALRRTETSGKASCIRRFARRRPARPRTKDEGVRRGSYPQSQRCLAPKPQGSEAGDGDLS